MWLSLLHLAYVGVLLIIMLAGIVLAIRKRAHLGTRASNRLAAGAGLVSIDLAVGLTLTYLPNAVVYRANRLLPGYGFEIAVSLLRMVLETAGLILVIAAVFAARAEPGSEGKRSPAGPDAAAAPGDEPADDAVKPTKAARGALALVIAVAVAVVAAAWMARRGPTDDRPPWQMSEDQTVAQCRLSHHSQEQLALNTRAVERMLLRKGDGWLRVYVAEPDNYINACEGGPHGFMQSFGARMDPDEPGQLRFFGGYDSVLKARLLLGRMPTGAAFIQARLSNGQIIQGNHDGDVFVIWAPGISVDGAQVTATNQEGVVIATAPAPTEGD
jgi:hypothetical protein